MSQLQTIPGDHQAVRKTASDYQQKHRKQIAGKTCECGRVAHRFKVTGFICQRCDELEIIQSRDYLKKFKAFEELSVTTRHKLTRKSHTERMAENDRGESDFTTMVRDLGRELVVLAHGEYHLMVA